MTVLAMGQSWYVLGTTKCVFDRYIAIFIVTIVIFFTEYVSKCSEAKSRHLEF